MMNYKEYIAKVEYDDEADIFHGSIINIRDVITFQGSSVKELKQAFIDSVEDYIEFCYQRELFGAIKDASFNKAEDIPFDADTKRISI